MRACAYSPLSGRGRSPWGRPTAPGTPPPPPLTQLTLLPLQHWLIFVPLSLQLESQKPSLETPLHRGRKRNRLVPGLPTWPKERKGRGQVRNRDCQTLTLMEGTYGTRHPLHLPMWRGAGRRKPPVLGSTRTRVRPCHARCLQR